MKRILVLLAAALATLSCAAPGPVAPASPEITIDGKSSGSLVTLRVGQRLMVLLSGNPTTGYVWRRAPGAEALLAQQGEPQFTPASRAIGAGGTFAFAFRAVAPGTGRLALTYSRPFIPGAPPASTFEITLQVIK